MTDPVQVTQDGGTFYVEYDDGEVDVFTYPWPVMDGDMEDAEHARNWFNATHAPNYGKVTFK